MQYFSKKFCSYRKDIYLCNPNRKKGQNIRGVAQLASASGLGPEGPVFESQYPDFIKAATFWGGCFIFADYFGEHPGFRQ